MDIATFISRWHMASGGEQKTKASLLTELCDALGVPRPDVPTGDIVKDRYIFEADVLSVHEGGKTTTLKVDLFKRGHFILEAKQGSNPGDPKVGHGKRGSEAWNKSMQNAYGQAVGYARSMDDPPPFILVCDLGYFIETYADFDHSGHYRPFPNAQKHRRYFADLAAHASDLRAVFLDPLSLDPARAGIKVTREIAEDLAQIAKLLEGKGHAPTLVAKFLMRCLFTMFAEDVDLLPDDMFTTLLDKKWTKKPETFVGGVEQLWRVMNSGGYYGSDEVRHFNGGLFEDPVALPLDAKGLEILLQAAKREWADVEPSIFGTLLERALDPKERHKLGAHFTPRAYVERLVRPTIEEPLRVEWENAQALALKLRADGKLDGAREIVHAFHQKLCATRVLDPACGSGNFLYVTLNILKQIESEVLAVLVELGEKQEQLIRITPGNFRGIEVKPWGKEIAELVLWIGYLQWHYRSHGKGMPPPSPVLQDYGNIECRDAVLAWDKIEFVTDDKGKPITRWDGETYKISPVTGAQMPDESARVPRELLVGPRKSTWPSVDFVVGNPPFIGNKRMRTALGDGYVEALRKVYSSVPETSDYFACWWHNAAVAARTRSIRRFGLIASNSITQTQGRQVVSKEVAAGLCLVFAIPDHPWVDSADGASVRIAMAVGQADTAPGKVGKVLRQHDPSETDDGTDFEWNTGLINTDFTIGVDVTAATALRASHGICFMGFTLIGKGFCLGGDELAKFGVDPTSLPTTVRRWKNGRDLVQAPSNRYVIDFFGHDEQQARTAYPRLYQHLLDTVQPERAQQTRRVYRDRWWIWGEARPGLRLACMNLDRVIVTNFAAKHRVFVFEPVSTAIDHNMYVIAIEDGFILGVLSSRVHITWMLAAGSTLEDRPLWVNSTCFLPFAFPGEDNAGSRSAITRLAEELDAHRKRQQAAHPDLTITGMYNVLEKLRASAVLTDKDRVIHEQGLVSVLKKIHDDLDAAVFEAYGWSPDLTDEQILEKLVALNAERAKEEEKGLVRWLRPDFQNPTGKKPETQAPLPTGDDDEGPQSAPAPAVVKPWPKKIAEQIAAVRDRVAFPGKLFTVESVASAFKGAKKKDIEGFLDGFAALGVLTAFEGPSGKRWRAAGRAG